MIEKKARPCAYTALTTAVAFGSLIVSGIRPVIDFGWMMVIGIGVALVLSNFVPTVYFGLLTGLAMIAALVADLTLLPLLIVRFGPFGRIFRSGPGAVSG